MQHIVHVLLGEDLVSFRDIFATTFRKLHSNINNALFSAISLTIDAEGQYILSPDEDGDRLDGFNIDKDNILVGLTNYFESMYSRKVTVSTPGNRSMVVIVWAKLFSDNHFDTISYLTTAINNCYSNLSIEVAGFTHDAVSCFIPNPQDRKSPEIYKKYFDDNISSLCEIREKLSGLRLIANRNMDNISLNLNEEAMARICAEFSALMCEHYTTIHPTVIDSHEFPFETFGVSSIIFDLEYYKRYIRNRIIIDKIQQQGIENRSFNMNALAQRTNPLFEEVLNSIHSFYDKQAMNAKAGLALIGNDSATSIVAKIDTEVKEIVQSFRNKLDSLLSDGTISVFESEALLALILGDDCSMFDCSAVSANEITLDDIIDESVNYFIDLDSGKSKLKPVFQSNIKQIRNQMRNIAVANRKREERLSALNLQAEDANLIQNHIDGKKYRFGDINYKLDIGIDTEPLEQLYQAHDVISESIDLRNRFAPIRNQGNQGSCASFAISSVIEALRHDSQRYSPAFLYWMAREAEGTTSTDSGATLYGVLKVATQKGVCTEEKMPYNPDIYTTEPTESAINDAMKCKVIEAKTVEPNIKDIKSALEDGFPVLIVSRIFDSFTETRSGFVRFPSAEEAKSDGRTDGHGNHAMVVCGFSDKERVFVVRNSWGTNFGENGYCYIPYSYAQQYFLQACIITEVTSSSNSKEVTNKKTIDFNMSDSNIEAAILQNLISEDQIELNRLAKDSDTLRIAWAQNVAQLGNVNLQSEIVKEFKVGLDERISKENGIIAELQNSKNLKVRQFKSNYIKNKLWLFGATLLSWILVYFLPKETWAWIVATVPTVASIGYICAYGYQWRKFRQSLRDEIQAHSNVIDSIRLEKESIDIKAHIHGIILKEIGEYRMLLLSEHQKLQLFNNKLCDLYQTTCDCMKTMSPAVPYPFLAVLENPLLDKYYSIWKNKMADSIKIKSVYKDFSIGSNLTELINNHTELEKAVTRGLKGFSMKEYITINNKEKWQFLPDALKMSEVIPDLDYRAKPFCPYNSQNNNAFEKFIFIKDITAEEMNKIKPYFSQEPLAVKALNPYTISVLNIVRYNLRS